MATTYNPLTLKEAMVAFLKADPGVSALVGNSIYPEVGTDIPTDFPRLTYQQVAKQDDTTLQLSTDQPIVHMAFHAWAKGPTGQDEATALATAVCNAIGPNPTGSRLKEFTNAWMPSRGATGGAVWIKQCNLNDEMSAEAQKAVGGAKNWIFQIVSVFLVCYNQNLYS